MEKTAERDWITPLEASLEMSIRNGIFISPDDIKQMRLHDRLDEQAIMRVSNRLSLYDREYIAQRAPIPNKRGRTTIESTDVATWIEEYPQTIQRLEEEGFSIPDKEDAHRIIEERKKRRDASRAGRHSKTRSKNP
jgi:hypothetical protein